MKKLLLLCLLASATSAQAVDIGVNINLGDPGYYGVIQEPRPVVIYEQPVIVRRTTVVRSEPLYLRVPPGHAKHWDQHCDEYRACDRQVYFVDEGWYETTYRGGPHGKHGKGHGKHHH